MSLTPQFLDELRARTVLSSLIGKSIKVTRAGREFKACCPFHNEKTPSFTINDDKGFYHCLAGETKVMTPAGRVAIADLVNTTQLVLARGGIWVPGQFSDFGQQSLWRIELSRNGVAKTIHATHGHRWFVRGVRGDVRTDNLRPGHRLESVLPQVSQCWELDPAGVRHGIVYGDGTLYQGTYGTVNLHGAKDLDLAKWFPDQSHHLHYRDSGEPYLRIYGGRNFGGMKQLPGINADPAYLRGFIAGYLAADGHVAKDGTVMLNSADSETLEAVRDIATIVGISTFGRTTLMRRGFGEKQSALHRIHFVNSTLNESMFLLPSARDRFAAHTKAYERLRWTVRRVERTDREEAVYCAVVPEGHAFALEDNILTGNCFGCGAHGDAIRWMTDQRGLPFMEAVKELADTAGLAVPAPDPRAAQRAEKAHSLRDVTEAAAIWYRERLADDEGAAARAYLDKRGLTRATVEAFGIGFAPDARRRMREVLKPFGDAMAVEAGMLIQPPDDAPKDRREPYDRFRGRLMIPIRDVRGRTIGFGGRILGAGEPKYLNSPDTPLFDKGRVLYNLDRAAPAARAAERLIIVEGYMDVIALAQAGIGEAVAPLGTALTEAQIELAWRQAPVPFLAFDGDAAGQRAALRAASRALPLLKPGYSLAFVRLPAGQDPDDIVKSGGRAAMDALVASAIPLVDLLWQQAQAEAKNDTPEERAGVRARLMEQVDTIADKDVAAHYRQAFRDRLDQAYFQRPQRQLVPGEKRGRYAPPVPPTPYLREVGARIDTRLGDAIITGLLRHPQEIAGQLEALSRLRIGNSDSAALLDALLDLGFEGKTGLDSDALLAILADRSVYNKATDLMRADRMMFSFTQRPPVKDEDIEPARRRAVRDLAAAINAAVAWPEVEDALQVATAAARTRMDEESFGEQQRLLRLKQDLTERLATLADGDAT